MLSLGALANKVFGSSNERKLKKYPPLVEAINALEPEVAALSDAELRARTDDFRSRVQSGTPLEDLIPEAFANVREAAKRTIGQRHFDVQLMGGMALNEGRISEMKTGEGKTLVATLPVYLNALTGRGVHVVTVNDYLAKRDAAWMGAIYKFLGLTVGVIVHELDDAQRRAQYECDVTYGTNNEFGFDYLRDNMKYSVAEMVQRGHYYAIVDEVDSILIDEARTPLIISGPLDDRSELYNAIDTFIPKLTKADYELDEKTRVVTLTEAGNEHVERLLTDAEMLKGDSLYDIENVTVVHHVQQALRAHTLFQRDRDYIVKNDEVIIIDEFTGRMMQGRRYSEGLHQALEAKEHVTIQPENQTLASITFQNYFRLYEKLAGMTGTALTEAEEFGDIYGLDVVEVPTNMPMIREDEDDEVYRTAAREIPGDHRADQGSDEARPADAGRHHLHREIRGPVGAPEEGQSPASSAERPLSRAGGAYHRPGRRARRRHHRHQHGRTRHRHSARRQSGHAAGGLDRGRGGQGQGADTGGDRQDARRDQGRRRRQEAEGARRRRAIRDRHRAA